MEWNGAVMLYVWWSLCVVCSECWMVRRKQTVGGNMIVLGGSNRQWWLVIYCSRLL